MSNAVRYDLNRVLCIKKMMVSSRLSSLTPSPTLEITAKAKALKADGVDVISFGAGEPDFDTPQNIKEALYQAVENKFIYYTSAAGIAELREAVAEKLKKDNRADYTPDKVIITPGAKQAIFEAVSAILNPGDEALVPQPHWVSYMPIIEIAGGKGVPIPVDSSDGFLVSGADIEDAVTPRSKLLILNSPNNPTGAVLDKKHLKDIADVCIEQDLYVISDEIYEHLIYGVKHVSIASLPDMLERTITINGFSKTYSMTGWRLGYAAGPKEVIDPMIKLQSHSVSNTASFVQKAGLAALHGDQTFIKERVDEFKARRDLIVGLLNGISGVECTLPDGAFYAFPDFRSVGNDSLRLSEYLLDEARVAAVPGVAFGDAGEGFLRFSYAMSQEKILEGMMRIKKAVERMS